MIQADQLCVSTPDNCASAAHTVHGVGTHDNGYVAVGTMTTPLVSDGRGLRRGWSESFSLSLCTVQLTLCLSPVDPKIATIR